MKAKGFTPLEIFEEFRTIYQNLCSVCKKPVRSFKNIAAHLRFLTGFTLLEVLIVVIIIGILASIALPQYISTLEKAKSAEAVSNIGTLRSSMDRYWFDRVAMGNYTNATLPTLDIDNPNNQTQRLYDYSLSDSSDIDNKTYTIYANRTGNRTDYWVRWVQTNNTSGRLFKSTKLGGPES